MDRYLSRKGFLSALGAAGLGLGVLVTATGGMPGALAQEETAPATAETGERLRSGELRARFYAEFTAALGEELGVADAAAVDTGIRDALATVVDGLQGDGLLTPGKAEAVKALLATLEAPVKPGPMFGPHAGMLIERLGPESAVGVQDTETAADEAGATEGPRAIAERFYPDFTAALGSELGRDADEVDGAIRLAMMRVIDTIASDDLPVPISPEALKAMVATADSPLSPGLLFAPPAGMMMRGLHDRHEGGHRFFGRDDDGERELRGGDGEDEEAAASEDEATDGDDSDQEEQSA